jgi:DNA (cytosine-5)-methyltransferase 1
MQRTDDLLFEYARILKEIQPKTFVCENVKGLVLGEAKKIFDEITELYKKQGYKVKCRLVNAKYFKVAQNRPRLIWIGIRKDFNLEPTHPKPQYAPLPIREVWKNIQNTIQQIEDAKYPEHYKVMEYLKKMKPGESGSDYNEKGSYFGLIRLHWDKPANTILQSDAKHISCSAIHPEEHRRLTIPELKRVSSFPDDFILLGTYEQQWERIGRAVPPLMMKAIAEHVRYKILDVINNITNNYNPSFYDEEKEKTGQLGFDFGEDFKKGFREY